MKRFYIQYNIGKAKYVVNHHDGEKKHHDGSDFFDIRIVKNKKELASVVSDLKRKGYVETIAGITVTPVYTRHVCHNTMPTLEDGQKILDNFTYRPIDTNTLKRERNHIIEIYPNGDPYGRGFQGSESADGGKSWFFRGDIGAVSRDRWRSIARNAGAILRYR